MKQYHGKLHGIYNEVPSWREFWKIVLFIGIPSAFIFAIIYTIL